MASTTQIDSLKDENYEMNWQIYSQLGEYERHFNDIQSNYRNLASTWLLAVFAGIGFMLVQKLNVYLPLELIIAAIALGGSLGIYLLWNLDHTIYQRLLEAVLVEGYKIENDVNWLPKVHGNMRSMVEEGVMASDRAYTFYFAPQVIFCIIFLLALSSWVAKNFPRSYVILSILLSIATFYLIKRDMDRNRRVTRKLVKQLLDKRITKKKS